ncbi:MAG: SIS domain-containing protein [Chlamydiae bacterium]|nr:SIS domain-containing protein [Chlamydiota bacterium]
MEQHILKSVEEAIVAVQLLKQPQSIAFIKEAAKFLEQCFKKGGKLLIAGNGGSLCDAMHFAEELTGIFRANRHALPAIALSDPGHLTCTANDLGYEGVFLRGVQAFGKAGDVFISLTTSGNSKNLLLALEEAKQRKLKTISFLGKTGGKMKGLSDLEWIVSGFDFSDRIQEAHMTAIHIIIEMLEKRLFYNAIPE